MPDAPRARLRAALLARLGPDQQQALAQLEALLRGGLRSLVERHRLGRLVAAVVGPGEGQGVAETELARVVGMAASDLGKCRRFAADFGERDAARWDAAGLAYTSLIHSDAAPDPKARRAFIEEGLSKGWKSGQFRAEANRRWPRRLGKGGRGGFDPEGRRQRKPPPNPGLPASLADLVRLTEQWVGACRQVWGPNRSALSGEEQAEGLARQLDAAHDALQGLAGALPGLRTAVREARRRLGAKAREE